LSVPIAFGILTITSFGVKITRLLRGLGVPFTHGSA